MFFKISKNIATSDKAILGVGCMMHAQYIYVRLKSQRKGKRSSFVYTFQILKYSVGSLTKQCLEFTDTILHILAAKSICLDTIVTFCTLRVD